MNYTWHWEFSSSRPRRTRPTTDWMISGLKVTIALGLSSWIIALVIGSVLGVLRTVPNKLLAGIAATYVEIFRNIPLLVQLFIWYFVAPELLPGGETFKQMNPFAQQFRRPCSAWVPLLRRVSANRSARASIRCRAGRRMPAAMGFTLAQTYRYVLLPMSFRMIVPPLTSEFLNIFKNSAVASTIGLLELAAQAASWWTTPRARMNPSSR